jgi:DNA-binding NtrC family response regulator
MARILVIDDDEALRTLLQRALQRVGHEVTTAEDGAVALKAMSKSGADVVVTDIFMPQMEGIETIRALRKLYPDVAIIAMTGGGNRRWQEYLEVAESFGAAAVLGKPFEIAALVALIDKALAERGS